jgi:hypothetical protein
MDVLQRIEALRAYLRSAGWLPASEVRDVVLAASPREGDWAPPEDRSNLWDFDRALARQIEEDLRCSLVHPLMCRGPLPPAGS